MTQLVLLFPIANIFSNVSFVILAVNSRGRIQGTYKNATFLLLLGSVSYLIMSLSPLYSFRLFYIFLE